jgi:hypothetical protein
MNDNCVYYRIKPDHLGRLVSKLLVVVFVTTMKIRTDDVIKVGVIQMNARLHDKAFNLAQAEEGIRSAPRYRRPKAYKRITNRTDSGTAR